MRSAGLCSWLDYRLQGLHRRGVECRGSVSIRYCLYRNDGALL